MFVTPVAKTTHHAPRQQAKCLAYTSPGWEHNPLYYGSANKTVSLTIIESCSRSSNNGGGCHMVHPTAGASSQGQPQQYRCKSPNKHKLDTNARYIPWSGQIVRSCHPYPFSGTILPIARLGMIN